MSPAHPHSRRSGELEFTFPMDRKRGIYMHFYEFLQRRFRRSGGVARSGLCAALLGVGLAGLLGALPAAASITGVCPDGSMFIVKKATDIPCRNAKQVDPHDMPPIRPAYLPRPHAWQIFQSQQDPNNPYNLVDGAREVREAAVPPPEKAHRAALPPVSAPRATAEPDPVATRPLAANPPALDDAELRDLALLIGLSQENLPARFEGGSHGALHIEIAHSRAFEAQLNDHFSAPPLGPVVVFSVRADAPGDFRANFTFVQGHVAFHPDSRDPRQLGVLAGALGELAEGERLIGYAVLPANVDLSQPTDVYWNDRRISVALLR